MRDAIHGEGVEPDFFFHARFPKRLVERKLLHSANFGKANSSAQFRSFGRPCIPTLAESGEVRESKEKPLANPDTIIQCPAARAHDTIAISFLRRRRRRAADLL